LSQEVLNQYHTDKIKISFVLFDEIEKASDALWNLLLGILDKASLTLGDNRKVDFSSAMIFMTSNLGAVEMSSLVSPRLGFQGPPAENNGCDAKLSDQISRTGIAAARRKFTPEFVNRLDKIVVFKSLGNEELRRIVDIELEAVQQRIQSAAAGKPFLVNVTDSAKMLFLAEGTDVRYGARPLKRAIERLLVQPLSNLMATGQIHRGDCIRVTHSEGSPLLTFSLDGEFFDTWETAGRAAA
jgi:ATP-dependent Clp protease ATP-binding subunit ClpB